jgi:hypothetical protein
LENEKALLLHSGLFPDRAIATKIKALFFFDKIKKEHLSPILNRL